MVEFLSFPLLSHLSSFSQLEESMGCVEEAGLQQQDKGNPLVVRLVFHLKVKRYTMFPFYGAPRHFWHRTVPPLSALRGLPSQGIA